MNVDGQAIKKYNYFLENRGLVQIGHLGELKNNPATPFVAGLLEEL